MHGSIFSSQVVSGAGVAVVVDEGIERADPFVQVFGTGGRGVSEVGIEAGEAC
ncbi:hypothetical protein R1T08_06755 [Streptomyces sp. SBC-4]|nr:hypothetical protein [Streptomyces sp. SBC-4]MDV5143973.1 hypothetical protein [Streptomyces sp. SBC-4]